MISGRHTLKLETAAILFGAFAPKNNGQGLERVILPLKKLARPLPGGGEGYCHIWAILVCAAVKGMVSKQFTLDRVYKSEHLGLE